MSTWSEFAAEAPTLAAEVRERFDAGRHKTLATLRADGSPRISGIECEIAEGELRFGSMPGSRKGADLARDPRFAIHSPTSHPGDGNEREWAGEAKIAGRAVSAGPVVDADGRVHGQMFTADLGEVVLTRLDPEATRLVIRSWTPEHGLRAFERE